MNRKVSYLPTVSTVSYGTGRSGIYCRESCEREERGIERGLERRLEEMQHALAERSEAFMMMTADARIALLRSAGDGQSNVLQTSRKNVAITMLRGEEEHPSPGSGANKRGLEDSA